MHRHKKHAPRMTKFERETERRRREMLGHLGQRKANVPGSFLRMIPRSWRLLLIPKRHAPGASA